MSADVIGRRTRWVSYLRVSTSDQADRDLSIPAQRHAVEEYAARHGATIAREYAEQGCSGRDPHRPEFRRMLGDVLAPEADVGVIVVHHTSRFTRDATEARLVKRRLRKAGIRILSVCQEIQDDPVGTLVEGLFECIDQYESEINGARTSSALREALRQGFFPGSRPPFGYTTQPVEVRPGVMRRRLVPDEVESHVVRELFHLYIANNGAKTVARLLNQRGLRHRAAAWSKDLVLGVLDDETCAGTFYWGKDTNAPAKSARALADTMAEFLVARTAAEISERTERALEGDLHVGGLLHFTYHRGTLGRVVARFAAGVTDTSAFARKITDRPASVARFERAMRAFGEFLRARTSRTPSTARQHEQDVTRSEEVLARRTP